VFAATALFSDLTAATVNLYNITSAEAPSLSSTCLAVLTQSVTCDPSLIDVSLRGLNSFWYYSDSFLSGLCTNACASGLSTWMRRVNGACANQRMITDDGNLELPSYIVEYWTEVYSQTCVTNQ